MQRLVKFPRLCDREMSCAPEEVAKEAGEHHCLEQAEHDDDAGPVVGGIDSAVEGVHKEERELRQLHRREGLLDFLGDLHSCCRCQVVAIPAAISHPCCLISEMNLLPGRG